MESIYRELMAGKSNEGLQKYIDNSTTYKSEAVEYAIAEMQKRGRIFLDEELLHIRQKMQLRREDAEAEEKEAMKPMDINVVTDATAPSYYSQRAIYGFGIFFSVLFGAVLLAINLKNAGSKKGAWQVIIFGVIYSAIQIYIISIMLMSRKFPYVLSVGVLGVFFMNELFWRKYIGKDTKYRTKPIWQPLIIGLVIFIPLVLAIIYTGV